MGRRKDESLRKTQQSGKGSMKIKEIPKIERPILPVRSFMRRSDGGFTKPEVLW